MKTLKQMTFLVAVIAAVFFTCCKKESLQPSLQSSLSNSDEVAEKPIKGASCGNVTVVDLIAGQNMKAGYVIVSNNKKSVFVTYKVNEGMNIEELNLYVGDFRLMPKTKTGNPIPGQFTFVKKFSEPMREYTFTIPIFLMRNCFKVAAHATLRDIKEKSTEGAWGQGLAINESEGSWGMYFGVCKQSCSDEEQ